MKESVLYWSLLAKFSTLPEMKEVLSSTGDAELWHGAPRIPKARQTYLEMVRSKNESQRN